MHVPDIDGMVYIKNEEELKIGNFVKCKVIDSREYDLIAEII